MRVYRERLGVPASWWLVTTACVLLLGTTLWAGLSLLAAVAIYVGLEALCAAILLSWGAITIEVTQTELAAGSQHLPLARIGEVTALDAAQTRALRGPRADPAAYLIVRPYLHESVYVEVAGRPPGQPYWLIATRTPARLAEAIDAARTRTAGQPPCDDALDDHVTQAGSPGRADATRHGKDGNAR